MNRNELKRDGFLLIPKSIANIKHMPSAAVRVYGALCDRLGENESVWPSVNTIAEDTGLSVRHVRNMLRALEFNELITTTERHNNNRQRSNCYVLYLPKPDFKWQEYASECSRGMRPSAVIPCVRVQ